MKRLLVVLLGLLLLAPTAANAARFGKQEQIERIAPAGFTGPAGERLFLGYKTTSFWLGAGLYLKDDGYVLGISGDDKSYFPLSADKIREGQAAGLLPDPLPTYQISTAQYLLGYSFWPLLVVVIAWTMIETAVKKARAVKRRAKPATALT